MEVVASLSQGRTAAAQYDLFTHNSVPVIFEPRCTIMYMTGQYIIPLQLRPAQCLFFKKKTKIQIL